MDLVLVYTIREREHPIENRTNFERIKVKDPVWDFAAGCFGGE